MSASLLPKWRKSVASFTPASSAISRVVVPRRPFFASNCRAAAKMRVRVSSEERIGCVSFSILLPREDRVVHGDVGLVLAVGCVGDGAHVRNVNVQVLLRDDAVLTLLP